MISMSKMYSEDYAKHVTINNEFFPSAFVNDNIELDLTDPELLLADNASIIIDATGIRVDIAFDGIGTITYRKWCNAYVAKRIIDRLDQPLNTLQLAAEGLRKIKP